MSAGKMLCDCGCGVEEHFARLKEIRLEVALDPSRRRTTVARRFLVRQVCYEPYIAELQAQRLLQELVQRYVKAKAPWYWRLPQFRKITRLQFAILIRNSGLEETKKRSIRSACLFVVSPRIAGLLWRYWAWADKNTLSWRWKLFPVRSKTPKPTSNSSTVIINPPQAAFSPSQSQKATGSAASQ
jgi:hypothetical protein